MSSHLPLTFNPKLLLLWGMTAPSLTELPCLSTSTTLWPFWTQSLFPDSVASSQLFLKKQKRCSVLEESRDALSPAGTPRDPLPQGWSVSPQSNREPGRKPFTPNSLLRGFAPAIHFPFWHIEAAVSSISLLLKITTCKPPMLLARLPGFCLQVI